MMMPEELKQDKPEYTLAQSMILKFFEAHQNMDVAKLEAMFTKDAFIWGTAEDEYRKGLDEIMAQFNRDWSQSDSCTFTIKSWVKSSEGALWAAADCAAKVVIQGTEYRFENLRGSINITQEDHAWKICFMHSSFPDMRNIVGNSFPSVAETE